MVSDLKSQQKSFVEFNIFVENTKLLIEEKYQHAMHIQAYLERSVIFI